MVTDRAREVLSHSPISEGSSEMGLCGVSAYINAGGRGSRLNSVFVPDEKLGITKALLQPATTRKNLIEHQVDGLLAEGIFENIVVGVGDHELAAEFVRNKYKDVAQVNAITYDEQLGNGGDFLRAVRDYPKLFAENIFVSNVDTFTRINRKRVFEQHRKIGAYLTFVLTRSRDVPNYQAFYIDHAHRIIFSHETSGWSTTPSDITERAAYRASSTGSVILAKQALETIDWSPGDGSIGLYREITGKMIATDRAYAYDNGDQPLIDIGTADTWARVNHPSYTFITDN